MLISVYRMTKPKFKNFRTFKLNSHSLQKGYLKKAYEIFVIFQQYTLADTLMKNIGDTLADKLIVKIKNSDGPCSNPIIAEVFLNYVKLNYNTESISV